MENTVKERLKKFLKQNKIKGTDFCSTIGVSSGFIAGMRESIQPDKLKSIAINYPVLDIGWLMTGEGSMHKSDTQPSTIENGNIVGNIANNSNIISTSANGNNNKVQTSVGGENKETGKEVNKLKLEISKLKAEIERLNEKNAHLMENMQVKDDLIASLKAMIEVLKGK